MQIFRFFFFIILATITLFPYQVDFKVRLFLLALTVSVLVPAIQSFFPKLKDKDPVTISFLLFLISAVISTIFSVNKDLSLKQLIVYLGSFIIFQASFKLFTEKNQKNKLIIFFVILTEILSVITFYSTVIFEYNSRTRSGASFWWPYFGHNHLSSLLIFSIPLIIYLIKITKKSRIKIFWICLLISQLVTFYLTFARVAIVSLVLGFLLTAIFFKVTSWKKLFLTTILLLSLTFFLIYFLPNLSGSLGVKKYYKPFDRSYYWNLAIKNFNKYPVLGSGPNTFITTQKVIKRGTLRSDYSHNYFLQVMSDMGALGLISFITLLAFTFTSIYKKTKEIKAERRLLNLAIIVGLMASLFINQTDYDFMIPSVFLYFFIFISIALS